MVNIPSPAIAIVGRHNSGKTTLIEKVIGELSARGLDVGSIKHHSHKDFEIDHKGKDSYRHRAAGATETVIASPTKMARVKTLEQELECAEIVRSMPGHDIIIVEGYRKSGLPTIELMRGDNPADEAVAKAFAQGAESGLPLDTDFTQLARSASRGDENDPYVADIAADIAEKMPSSNTVAIVTDIPCAKSAADSYGIPCFDINDIVPLAEFLIDHFSRQRISVVIQAGGESKRMGQSKALVPFDGKPLICRIIRRLWVAADELIITTNEPEKLGFLKDEFPDLDIRLVSDKHEKRGALPGLHTALDAASCPFVAIVACDMVFASAALVVAESIEMAEEDADIVVPVNKHGYEPFHAIYRKDACLPAVIRSIEAGNSRVQSIFDDPDIKVVEFPQNRVCEVEPRGGCFINTNTPEELSRIEETFIGE